MNQESPYFSLILPIRDQCRETILFLFRLYRYFESRKESFELIIVDDGSTDQTSYVMEKFAIQFKNITVRKFSHPKGLGLASREGLSLGRGKFYILVRPNFSLELIDELVSGVDDRFDGLAFSRRSFHSSLYPPDLFFLFVWKFFDRLFCQFLPGGLSPRFGPILISRSLGSELVNHAQFAHSGFQFEFVFLAHHWGKEIISIPIREHFFVRGLPLLYFFTVLKELIWLRLKIYRVKSNK